MINGQCPHSKRMLDQIKISTIVGILARDLDDVNSCLLRLTSACLDFALALVEGEGIFPLEDDIIDRQIYYSSKNIAGIFTPNQLL